MPRNICLETRWLVIWVVSMSRDATVGPKKLSRTVAV